MDIEQLAPAVLQRVPKQKTTTPQSVDVLPGVRLLMHHVPSSFEATIYQPVFCLIVQGAKETTLGERTVPARAGKCLLVSHDLPVLWRVTRAPYLAVLIDIDVGLLRAIYDEIDLDRLGAEPGRAMEVRESTPSLLETLYRYLALADAPADTKVLAPLLKKELHYRLLVSPAGGMLRHLVRRDSHASSIARAIAYLRENYREPIGVPELARKVGMSTSSFHQHFRAVTDSTPLQYQKDLRLHAARRLLRSGESTVSSAAFDVGYESPNQFSREYTRKFGLSPRDDLP